MNEIQIKINTLSPCINVSRCVQQCAAAQPPPRPSPAPRSADLTVPPPTMLLSWLKPVHHMNIILRIETFKPHVFCKIKNSNWALNLCLLWFTYAKISSCLCNNFGNKDFDMSVCMYVCLYVCMSQCCLHITREPIDGFSKFKRQ